MTGCALLQFATQAKLLTGGSGVRLSMVLGRWCASVAALTAFWQLQQRTSACPHQPDCWPCTKARGSAGCASVRLRPALLQPPAVDLLRVDTQLADQAPWQQPSASEWHTGKAVTHAPGALSFVGRLEAPGCCRLTQQSRWRSSWHGVGCCGLPSCRPAACIRGQLLRRSPRMG